MRSRWAPWVVYATALFAYIITVVHRTTFSIVSVEATQRFGTGATLVAMFAVLQIFVYALLQVPAGLLADRLGPRTVIVAGALLMAAGQAVLAFSYSLPLGIFARVLVAVGDACTWTPIGRMLPNWFGPRVVPILSQCTGAIGSVGQLLSAVPFAAAFHRYGWTPAIGGMAGVGVLTACLVLACVRDSPHGPTGTGFGATSEGILAQVARVLRTPGTLTGFFGHWICSMWAVSYLLMWGYTYLAQGEGLDPAAIGLVFGVRAACSAASGLVLGVLSGRHPLHRTDLMFVASTTVAIPWLVVIVWPGPAPLWLLVILHAGLGVSDPGSSVGFDVARTTNIPEHVGTAIGVTVMGGFLAGLATTLLIGVTLDVTGDYSLRSFRLAMATQFLFYAVGLVGLVIYRRKHRRWLDVPIRRLTPVCGRSPGRAHGCPHVPNQHHL